MLVSVFLPLLFVALRSAWEGARIATLAVIRSFQASGQHHRRTAVLNVNGDQADLLRAVGGIV
jgi:hypothetical protein